MWVIIILVSLAVLITLILSVPLDFAFQMDTHKSPKFKIRLVWLFGLVDKDLKQLRQKPKKKEKVVEDKQKSKDRIEASTVYQILKTKGLLKKFKRLLMDVLSCLKLNKLAANLRIGLDNPADTGLLFALIGPANLVVSSCSSHEISVQPSYDDEATLEGHLHGTVSLRPIQLVAPLAKFAFSLPAIRSVKILVVTKWRRKK